MFHRKPWYLVIAACVAVVAVWSLAIPSFEAPDEQAHLGTINFLIQNNRLPQGSEIDMTRELALTEKMLGIFRDGHGNNSYTYHPDYHVPYAPGAIGLQEENIRALNTPDMRSSVVATEAARYPVAYYGYDSVFVRPVWGADIFTRLFAARFGSVLLAIVMAWAVWQTGRTLFKNRLYAGVLTVMVMLQPMVSFLSAGVNSDNLHNALFFVVIWLSLSIVERGASPAALGGAIAATVLDVFTKPQGFVAIPVIALAILTRAVRERRWKLLFWVGLVVAVVLTLGVAQWDKYKWLFLTENSHNASFIEYLRFSANKLLAQNVVWYWGVFKWLGVVLPPIYWRVANRVVLISVLGLGVYLWRVATKKKIVASLSSIIFLLASSIIYALAIFWFDWQYTKSIGFSIGIQARYFFPTITAHFSLMLTGLLSLAWSPRLRKYIARGVVLLFTWLQVGGLWRLITTYYDVSSLPTLLNEMSQYKPWFAKGQWWDVWAGLYALALIGILWVLFQPARKKEK